MPSTTRITVELEIELKSDDPATTFKPALRAIADRMLAGPNVLQSEGTAIGSGGAARWRVRSWAGADLTRCVFCKRMVPRVETDVTENGDRCQQCTDQSQITQHWLNVEQNAYDRGYTDGFFDGDASWWHSNND